MSSRRLKTNLHHADRVRLERNGEMVRSTIRNSSENAVKFALSFRSLYFHDDLSFSLYLYLYLSVSFPIFTSLPYSSSLPLWIRIQYHTNVPHQSARSKAMSTVEMEMGKPTTKTVRRSTICNVETDPQHARDEAIATIASQHSCSLFFFGSKITFLTLG